jgi:hypothetical protein
VPVVTCDFAAMYPSVFVLLGLWDLLSAERIIATDATDDTRALLDRLDATTLRDPRAWRDFNAFCLVEPAGDVLPVRARYAEGWFADPSEGDDHDLNTALPLVMDGPRQWWTLADCLASKLVTGKPPRILQAVRFVGEGRVLLRPIMLRGEIPFDPETDDLVALLLRERERSRGKGDSHTAALLKVMANSVAFGLTGEERLESRHPHKTERAKVRAWSGEPAPRRGTLPSAPHHGDYSCSPIAALVTGGARLVLALAERAIKDRGGRLANVVTDGLAVVATEHGGSIPCPGGSERDAEGREAIRALSYAEVDAVRAELRALSPTGADFLRIEPENFRSDGTRRHLSYFGTATLRYCLFDRDSGDVVKGSAHVIGNYDYRDFDVPGGQEGFARAAWAYILTQAGVIERGRPAWLGHFVTQTLPIQHPRQVPRRTDQDRGRPFGFYTTAAQARWAVLVDHEPLIDWGDGRGWINAAGEPVELISNAESEARLFAADAGSSNEELPDGSEDTDGCWDYETGTTWEELLEDYAGHPEAKADGPDGKPCTVMTQGLLRWRHVRIREVRPMGRTPGQLKVEPSYDDALAWLRSLSRMELQEMTGCSLRMSQSIRRGDRQPAKSTLVQIAQDYADRIAAFAEQTGGGDGY